MAEALWLARLAPARPGERPTCLRCTTAGEVPGPDQRWRAVTDPFEAARWGAPGASPWAAALAAEPLGEPETLVALGRELLAPLAPTKIIAIGRNYAAHAAELGNEVPSTPISFFKPPSCLLASGQPLALPRGYERVDMEAELVLVIGARARSVRAEDAWAHVAGYLMGNDVSCRDLQRADKLWTRAKGFDGFGPVSAFARLVPPGWVLPADLEVHGFLDDERVQAGSVAQMIFSIPTLIEHLSACMTLEPGDMIFTGTPAGVSALEPGKVTRVALGGREDFHLAPVVTPVV